MTHRSRRKIYETAFDSKVERKPEDGSGDLFDRIANHPILQLLNPKRKSRTSGGSSRFSFSKNSSHPNNSDRFNANPHSNSSKPHEHKARFQAGSTPKFGRRGARSKAWLPARSLSSHHITSSNLRPIGLSKSDDQILNSVSDSPDEDDYLEGYAEGKQAEDLARDLITLHITAEDNHVYSKHSNRNQSSSQSSPYLPHRRHRKVAQRGMSVDARIGGWCSSSDYYDGQQKKKKNGNFKTTSIMALHHPNVSSPRIHHVSSLCSPQLQHITGNYYNASAQGSYSSINSSPRLSLSSSSSPKIYLSSATPSPRLIHERNYAPKLVKSNASSPKFYHSSNSTQPRVVDSGKSAKSQNHYHRNLMSSSIVRVLQSSYDSNSDTSASSNTIGDDCHVNSDKPSTSGSVINKQGVQSKLNTGRTENLAKMKPLELHTPPGTAPLPLKFIKKTPLTDQSPSSWFSPPRQGDLNLPVKRSIQSRYCSTETSSSDSSSLKIASTSLKMNTKNSGLFDLKKDTHSSGDSQSSLNSSMEVLMDTVSQMDRAVPNPSDVKNSTFSLESVMSGGSSLESLKSSMSEGCKSMVMDGGKGGTSWRNMGSNSSLPLRPSLLLPAPHRSLIQSAKFQILSPISDKSQEPSSTDTGGPIVGGPTPIFGCGLIGGGSPHTSPQEILEQTPVQPKNIHEDFRNVHHILPGPPAQRKTGSDSGISIEYITQSKSPSGHTAFKDLPFDMPKLRRRLAAARSCPSTSNSSLTSSGAERGAHSVSLNPRISRLQADDCRSGTSSSNSSDWDVQSSAASSNEGTPKRLAFARESLALDLGCKAMATTGQKVDVAVPLNKQAWYHGAINRADAETLLRAEAEGAYLVRSIDTPRKEFSLALKAACGFMHLKIQYISDGKGYKVGRGSEIFPSVSHVIHHHSIHRLPIRGAEHMFLLKPVVSDTL